MLNNKEKECEYQESLGKVWDEVRVREEEGVEEEWRCFREEVLKCAKWVCGMKNMRGRRKDSELRNEEVSVAVSEKRRAHESWLQRGNEEVQ